MSQDRRLSSSQQSKMRYEQPDNHGQLMHKPRVASSNLGNQKKLNYNFTVAVRVRPHISNEQNGVPFKQSSHIQYEATDKNVLVLEYPEGTHHSYFASKHRKFNFDNIFIHRKNRDIYEELVKPKLAVLKQNINLTVLTYGITGSGKTHTIFGNSQLGEQGLVMMCFEDVMKQAANQDMVFSFCFMQIYNQQVHDLLRQQNTYDCNTNSDNGGSTKLKAMNVMEDSKGRINIPQLTKVQIRSSNQLKKLVEKGNATRASSSNLINKLSSRSHALMQLFCYNQKTKIQNVVTIIDLAGSERHSSVFRNGPATKRSVEKQNRSLQKEGSNINRSLLALGSCIKGLENGEAHIPYRDSKLTRILKDDLSGKAQNIMIACVGRNVSQIEQTINTLNYASRAAKIKVQKFTNSPIHNSFECPNCYKLTNWKQVVKKIPVALLKQKLTQQNQTIQQIQTLQQPAPGDLDSLSLAKALSSYKVAITQQYNSLRNQISSTIANFLSFQEDSLYPKEPTHAVQRILEEVNSIFQHNEAHLIKKLENGIQIAKECSSTQLVNQFYSNCGSSCSQLFGLERNLSSANSSNESGLFKQCLITKNNLTIQSYREQAINDLNQTYGNLRKKLSLKNNKDFLNSANTTNATLADITQAANYDAYNKYELNRLPRLKRMSPDVEVDAYFTQRISYKKTVIDKIEQAKKKCVTVQLPIGKQNMDLGQVPKAKNYMRIKQDELDQICVSSFTEESNQYEPCC